MAILYFLHDIAPVLKIKNVKPLFGNEKGPKHGHVTVP